MPQSKPEGCLERRFIRGGEVRARGGDKPGIDGYAAVFDQEYDNGWFRETIRAGAFARALREKQDVRCLFNHDANNLLGRSKSKTLRLAEDNTGLRFDCDMNLETRVGADVQGMIQRGDVDGCSFGFMVRKQTWREETDDEGRTVSYRDIEDVDLFDVGPVTYPAYEGTSVAERSLWPQGIPAEIRSHVPALRSDAKTKKVDGEDLTADSFLIVGDPDDTSTWKLPWKFSTDEKTKSHLRNALARFDQLDGVSAEEKKKAKKKLLSLCKKYGIDVSDEESKSLRAEMCSCPCDDCEDGNCADCDCEGCDSENCDNDECRCGEDMRAKGERERLMRLCLAQHS